MDEKPSSNPEKPAAKPPSTEALSLPPPRNKRRQRLVALIVAGFVLIVLIAAGVFVYVKFIEPYETTDDAFIAGNVPFLSARVPGPVVRLLVDDNQRVKVGDPILEIDDSDFQTQLAQAQANLVSAKDHVLQAKALIIVDEAKAEQQQAAIAGAQAIADRAKADEARYRSVQSNAVSRTQVDLAQTTAVSTSVNVDVARDQAKAAAAQVDLDRADLETATAQVGQAEASLRQAELNLSYTKVRAPATGRITHRTVEQGAYINVGQSLLAIVPDNVWVIANFKETQLKRIRPGQFVSVEVDAYPGRKFKAKIDSLQAGSGANFSLLPPENAVGNYVKVVQRVPVKIIFDEPLNQSELNIAPGMSVEPKVTVKWSDAPKTESLQAAQTPWRPRVNPWLIALAVMLATFMEVLDTSIASVALPHIAGNLGASTDEATWVLTSYLVSNAIILPTSAWFGSFFGRKRFLIGCIIIFTASSFACGAATSLGMLILARILQGAGGGALQPLAQAILLESFPPAKRGAAMAVYGIGIIVAPIIGPTLGGWLTDSYSWRWAFYINIPVGALAVFLISIFVEDPPYIKNASRGRFDAFGFALLAIWLATLQITLDKGQEVDWFSTVWLRWFAGISVLSFVTFIIWELTSKFPIVNLRTLANRNFAAGCAVFLMFGAVLYALVTMLPLFLQTLLGYTALDAGLTVSPRGIGVLVALAFVGVLSQRVNLRLLMLFGFMVLGISCFVFSRMTLEVAMRNIIPSNLLMGFGMGFIFVPLTTLSVGTLSDDQIGSATGIQNLMRNVGGSVGISWLSTMLARYGQIHQNFLTGQFSSLQPAYQRQLATLQKAFAPHFSPADALLRAEASIYHTVVQQANYWAYVDTFYKLMWACVISLCGLIFFKNVKSKGGVAVH